jgi:hypothetical protein
MEYVFLEKYVFVAHATVYMLIGNFEAGQDVPVLNMCYLFRCKNAI